MNKVSLGECEEGQDDTSYRRAGGYVGDMSHGVGKKGMCHAVSGGGEMSRGVGREGRTWRRGGGMYAASGGDDVLAGWGLKAGKPSGKEEGSGPRAGECRNRTFYKRNYRKGNTYKREYRKRDYLE